MIPSTRSHFSAVGGVAFLSDVTILVENTTVDAKGLHTNESYTLHVDSPTVTISANTMWVVLPCVAQGMEWMCVFYVVFCVYFICVCVCVCVSRQR